jgi:hypothetical protein
MRYKDQLLNVASGNNYSFENHAKPINTFYGQNVELLNVKAGGTYSDHCTLKG